MRIRALAWQAIDPQFGPAPRSAPEPHPSRYRRMRGHGPIADQPQRAVEALDVARQSLVSGLETAEVPRAHAAAGACVTVGDFETARDFLAIRPKAEALRHTCRK